MHMLLYWRTYWGILQCFAVWISWTLFCYCLVSKRINNINYAIINNKLCLCSITKCGKLSIKSTYSAHEELKGLLVSLPGRNFSLCCEYFHCVEVIYNTFLFSLALSEFAVDTSNHIVACVVGNICVLYIYNCFLNLQDVLWCNYALLNWCMCFPHLWVLS